LPSFLAAAAGGDMPGRDQLAEAFALTGFFLDRHVLSPRGLGLWDGRENFIAAVTGGSRPAAG
jgi:DNA repair protein RecO (recombination protein O)